MAKRSKILIAAAACLSLAGGFGGYAGYLQLTGNFDTVVEGELHRSAQPSASQLERYIRKHGIETVINLRGKSDAPWYDDEIRVAIRLSVNHIDFRMSASKMLTAEKAEELLAIMETAPKPILIHCQAGADRTGLVAALYSSRIAKRDEGFAEGQLSFYYGHVGLPVVSAAWAMDESWESLEDPAGSNRADVETAFEEHLPNALTQTR